MEKTKYEKPLFEKVEFKEEVKTGDESSVNVGEWWD